MPQMMPLMWLFLYIYFLLIFFFILMIIYNYFFINFKFLDVKKEKLSFLINKFEMKW